MDKLYDVCIVGGGSAGLAAAVYIKQKNKEISVAIIEQLSRVGKKLITTGNGRCNITNADQSLSHYHGENVKFAEYALKKYDNKVIEEFFSLMGVPICYDETGRAYPRSFQASSVVDALRFSCENLKVDTYTDCTVTDISKDKDIYLITAKNTSFKAKNVIFATGLYSGGARLGCDGTILKLLKSKGYRVIKTSPAIVQIKTDNSITRQLKGIKINASAKLLINGKLVREEFGEVLFCDYGLSGPPILQIAREVERLKGDKLVCIDLMHDKNLDEIVSLLSDLKRNLSYRNLDEFLSGVLNKRLGQAVVKSVGLKLSDKVSSLSHSDIEKLVKSIKNQSFSVISTTGFDNSQVTAGGLDTSGFGYDTMMSKTQAGIYAVGELLDIDGDCGGYNLHFAFSSAFCAADSILKG